MHDLDNLTAREIADGYTFDESRNAYICTDCGKVFETSEIFCFADRYFEASRAVRMHAASEHGNRLSEILLSEDKYLQLTDNQKELLRLFSEGISDSEAAGRLHVSPSTVRHQRFVFREKAKAAKMYMAVWEMVTAGSVKNKIAAGSELLPVHGGAKMIDERYEITEEENAKIIASVFTSMEPLKLKVFSSKEKKKIVTLRKIAGQFEKDRKYTEKEVNGILADIYDDYAVIRRYLIEYGFMNRTRDCSSYWLQ